MSKASKGWKHLANQLDAAASKIETSSYFAPNETLTSEDWPCWVPTQECHTFDGSNGPVASINI